MKCRCLIPSLLLITTQKRFLTLFILFLITGTTYGQWVKKADEISKRAESNNIIYNNKLYVFGGFGDNPVIEKTNEVYDIATNKWSRIASFPAGKEITHQGVILVDDNVWLIGGRSVDAHGPASSQVIIYNITSNTWTNGPELINPATGKAFPIGAAGYALLGRTIHVFGGFGPTLCEDQSTLHLTIDVDKYLADTKNVTWENKLAPMPIPRNHLSYVVLGGKIYAFGGQFKHDCGAADQVYCHVYDSATDKWTRLTDLPKARSHAEAATFAVDGKIFLVAGQGYNDLTQNTTYQFTPQANNGLGAWTNLTAYKLPGSFLGLSAKLAGSSFIITNGALNNYANERKETYIANVTRTKTRTFGFTRACVPVDVQTGNTSVISNLLFCIEDTTPYTATTDVNWLTIIKNQSGEVTLNGQNIEVLINTVGLLPGRYTGNVTAKNTLTGSSASFCINLNVTTAQQYTLNVATLGGGTVSRSPDRSSYDANTIVKLTATPATGWKFEGWNGDTITTINPINRVMNTNRNITATFTQNAQPAALISDVTVTSGKKYEVAQLNTAVTYYTDRDYKVTAIPLLLTETSFIKTPNDDKLSTATNLLSFTLNQNATVYIAYDPRATTLPAWLSSWKRLTDKVGINDPKLSSLTLYSKDFAAGKVTIGGNRASPSKGSLCGYIVIARAQAAQLMLTTAAIDNYSSSKTNGYTANKPVLFPNPVNKNFRVLLPESYEDISNLNIVDINGKAYAVPTSMISKLPNQMEVNIATLSLKPGIYSLLMHTSNGKTSIIKFIIE